MSWPAIRWAARQKVWNASERAVLATLAHYARLRDGRAWPGVDTLARECGMCEKAVYLTIRRLAGKGLLEIEGHRARRKYRLCLEAGTPVDGAGEPDPGGGQAGNQFPEVGNRFPEAGNGYRRSDKDPNRKERRRRGATAQAVAAAADAADAKDGDGQAVGRDDGKGSGKHDGRQGGNGSGAAWTARLKAYREHGFWYADWGPKPGEVGCLAPRQQMTK